MTRLSTAICLCLTVLSASERALAADQPSPTCIVDKVRQAYADGRKAIVKATYKNLDQADDLDKKVNFEEKGCISSYGLDGSFSIASIASNFLSGIKDAVCSAADNYLANQVAGVSAGIDAPLGLTNVGGQLVRGGDGVNISEGNNAIDFKTDQWANDQFSRLPQVDSGYKDYNYDSGPDLGDQTYLDQQRGGTRR